MTRDEQRAVDKILNENKRRMKKLLADYDPLTGEGGVGDRVKFKLSDFPIPVQYIPVEMAEIQLIQELMKAGSIEKFILTHEWKKRPPSVKDVGDMIVDLREKFDFQYWAYTQIKIDDKLLTGLIPFKLNYAQIVVLTECERLRKADKPINIIICKARQWGGSTFSIFYQCWIALKWKPSHSFSVCAQVNGTAVSITRMLNTAFQHYDAHNLGVKGKLKMSLIPKTSEYVLRDTEGGQGSQVRNNRIRIGSAQEPDNLRGLPGSGVHFSEVAVWPDSPKSRAEDLVKSLTGGILPRPYTVQVFESTPKGAGNYFHRCWLDAKNGVSSFYPVFIPWYYIPHDTLNIAHCTMEEFAYWLWKNREETGYEGNTVPGKYFWRLWELGATLEGINWYRIKHREFADHADMASEAPSDDIEAFTFSGSKVFDVYHLDHVRADVKPPEEQGMLVSDGAKGAGVLKNIRFVPSEKGDLKIWRKPERDSNIAERYLVVVDVGGRNQTSDWSVIRVFDRAAMMYGGKPELVAQMRYHTDYDLLSYDAMRVAAWYCNALLVIESNTLETKDPERDTDGNMSAYILDVIGGLYENLYARAGSAESIRQGKPRRWGFQTNVGNKASIIGNLVTCVREHLWIEHDVTCIEEMALYEKNEKGQFSAPPGEGNHDDVLMANAIGLWICFREMETPHFIVPKGERRARRKDPNSVALL